MTSKFKLLIKTFLNSFIIFEETSVYKYDSNRLVIYIHAEAMIYRYLNTIIYRYSIIDIMPNGYYHDSVLKINFILNDLHNTSVDINKRRWFLSFLFSIQSCMVYHNKILYYIDKLPISIFF